MRDPGLHLNLENLREQRHDNLPYWGLEFQKEISDADIKRFLPEVHRTSSAQERLFVLIRGERECCGASTPVTNSSQIPAAEMRALQESLERFKNGPARNPAKGGGSMDAMIQAFELPDPEEYPKFYRLYRPHWWSRKRLAVIWGCRPYESDYGRVVLVPQAKSSRWWLWLLLLLSLGLAAWLAFLFWPKEYMTPGDDPYAYTTGQFLQLRWLPKTGVVPVKLEARSLRPGTIDFLGLLQVDTSTDQWKSLPEIKKPGRYRITWTPADRSLNSEFKEISFTGPAGETRLPTATLYLQPNPATPGQEVIAVVGASSPGADAGTGLRYFVQWEPGAPMEEVEDPDAEPATHTFAAPGDYLVTLRVQQSGDAGVFAGDVATAHVQSSTAPAPAIDRRPVPVARVVSFDPESRRVVVADAGSYLPDGGKIARYTIDWNDGSVEDFASPPAHTHQYASALPRSGQVTYICRSPDGQLGTLPLLLPPPAGTDEKTAPASSRQVLKAEAATDQLRIERQSERPVGRKLFEEVLTVVGPLSEGDRWLGTFDWQIAPTGGGQTRLPDAHSRGVSVRLPAGDFDVSVRAYDVQGTAYQGSARLRVPAETSVANLDQETPIPVQEESPPGKRVLARTAEAESPAASPGTLDHPQRDGLESPTPPDRPAGPSGRRVASGDDDASPSAEERAKVQRQVSPSPSRPRRNVATPSPADDTTSTDLAENNPEASHLSTPEASPEPARAGQPTPQPRTPRRPGPDLSSTQNAMPADASNDRPGDSPSEADRMRPPATPSASPDASPRNGADDLSSQPGPGSPAATRQPSDGKRMLPPPTPPSARPSRPPTDSVPTPALTPRLRVLAPNLVLLPTQTGNKLWRVQAILLKDNERLQPDSVQWTIDGKQQSSQAATVEFEPAVENPRIEAKAGYRGAVYTASRPLVDPNAQP